VQCVRLATTDRTVGHGVGLGVETVSVTLRMELAPVAIKTGGINTVQVRE
jgi:hypothetical protein